MIALSKKQPYPGLRPFGSGDEEFFFGREAQTRGLLQKLEASPLVAVVGRSGCGKSSLVRAGLVPLLAKELDSNGQQVWHVASFRPQGQPISELTSELLRLASRAQPVPADHGEPVPDVASDSAEGELPSASQQPLKPAEAQELRHSRLDAMLRRSSRGLVEAAGELGIPDSDRLLIIVDQFEEIFRFENPSGSQADEATAFVRLLMEAISADSPRIHVLLTMRLDFLGDCARFPRLPEAISDGQFLVPNLSRAERRAAIVEPAKKCGKTVRPEVTQRLLNEIGDDPDQLPVLQHVLMRMWQQAGDNAEITLKNYDDTGGVMGAISRHADQIYKDLPTDAHRLIAERLFKAISERDRRGRSIRRATALGVIAGIVAGSNRKASAAEAAKLESVIEAFRAHDCCFLMPPAGDKLLPSTLVDISHESLLRGWSKMTGESGSDGWIAEEERDGRIYHSLLDAVESGSTLSGKIALQRQQWWRLIQPNAPWAERYGNNFTAVEDFVRTSAGRVFLKRVAIGVLVALAVISSAGFATYYVQQSQAAAKRQVEASLAAAKQKAETAEKEKLTEAFNNLAQLDRDNLRKLDQARAKIQAQEDELNRRNRELDRTIRQAQNAVPLSDQKAQADLSSLLKASAANTDNTVQRPVDDAKDVGAPGALSSNTGAMWIGSATTSNLNTLAGMPAPLTAIQVDGQYLTNLDIYLRQGLPERSNYAQQPTVGTMLEGTQVQVLSIAPPFSRPSGEQYWAQVQVVKLALPAVYFQFAGGSRDQAQQISKALQDKGYKIPGEERTSAAASQREVRYYFARQTAIAGQLATDAAQALQQLGYGSKPFAAKFIGDPTKSNPDGKLELWVEIPPK